MDASSLVQRHPLQRLSAPSRSVSALIHLVGLVSFTYSFIYLRWWPNQVAEGYGGNYQFLTNIGLTCAHITFVFGLLADLLLSPSLFAVKNATAMISAPLCVLVSVLYWGISSIDKELVMPKDVQLPLPTDLSFHLYPALLLLFDLLLLSPPWTIGFVPAFLIPGVFGAGYWVWIEHCYSHNGSYPYPLMDVLSAPGRVALFSASAITMTGGMYALMWIYRKVNGDFTGHETGVPGTPKGGKRT